MNVDEAGWSGDATSGNCKTRGRTGFASDCAVTRRARPLLGTFVEIAVAGAASDETEAAVEAAFTAVATVHRLMSFHDDDSDVSRLNHYASSRPIAVHPWTCDVLRIAADLHRRSAGVFDIAVAPILQDLGLLPRHEAPPCTRAPSGRGDAVMLRADGQVRFRDGGVRIDLGGIAKGYAVDRAIVTLRAEGITAGVVNAGGDLAVFGPEPQPIHIRDPRAPWRMLAEVGLREGALATSGGRFDPLASAEVGESAVIDPRTAAPVRRIAGATVRAPTCVMADALTKIVMAIGEDAAPLLAHYGASALFVSGSGVHVSPDWLDGVRLAS